MESYTINFTDMDEVARQMLLAKLSKPIDEEVLLRSKDVNLVRNGLKNYLTSLKGKSDEE